MSLAEFFLISIAKNPPAKVGCLLETDFNRLVERLENG